jgi:hypothetical protein
LGYVVRKAKGGDRDVPLGRPLRALAKLGELEKTLNAQRQVRGRSPLMIVLILLILIDCGKVIPEASRELRPPLLRLVLESCSCS